MYIPRLVLIWIQYTTVVYIQVSSVSLASEDPVDEDSHRNYYLGIADYFFTGTEFYSTILYSTVLYCTVLYCVEL